MADLTSILQGIPFYSQYVARKQMNEQAPMQELQQVGALQGVLASVQQQQRAQQEVQRNDALRQAIQQLPPEQRTKENIVPLLIQHGNVKELVPLLKGKEEGGFNLSPGQTRFDASGKPVAALPAAPEKPPAEPEIVRLVNTLNSLPENDPRRPILQKAIDAKTFGREEAIRLAASMRPAPQPVAPTVVEIQDPNDPTKSIKIDAKTGQKIGNAPPKPATEKALPGPLQKQLTEAAELSDATERFTTSFKDEFGGKTVIGGLGNTYGRIMGDDTGQSQWWQDYELHQSQIRNKLFGSALTAPEIAAWEKSAINPRMDAKQIRENLARREKLERTALERLMKGAAVGGYKREQIEAFTGRSLADKPKGGGVPTIASDADYERLPSGAEFIDPQGQKRKKP